MRIDASFATMEGSTKRRTAVSTMFFVLFDQPFFFSFFQTSIVQRLSLPLLAGSGLAHISFNFSMNQHASRPVAQVRSDIPPLSVSMQI